MNIEENPIWINYVTSRNRSPSTFRSLKTGIKRFLLFFKEVKKEDITLEDIINKIKAENKLPMEDRVGIEKTWVEFASWLEKDYEMEKKYQKNSKQLAPKAIKTEVALLRKFLKFHDAHFPGKSELPKSISIAPERIENKKFRYRPKDVRKLLDVTKSTRDRAIILFLFQSSMDISTLCSLNYKHVKEELETGKVPLLIDIKRGKSEINYRTFVGSDSIEALKIYLSERRQKRYVCKKCGHSWKVRRYHCTNKECNGQAEEKYDEIKYNSPLFVNYYNNNRINPSEFGKAMKRYVILSGIVSKERLEHADKNPAGCHALRTATSSIMQYRDINQDIVNGLTGHKVEYNGTYSQLEDEELRKKYASVEQYLSLESIEGVEDLKEKMKKMEDQHESITKNFTAEIAELKNQLRNRAVAISGDTSEANLNIIMELFTIMDSNPKRLKDAMKELEKIMGG